jgi:SOS-response transcriptional repressor LexA
MSTDAKIALTPKMRSTLQFIVGYRAEHGYSPTLLEIAEAEGGVSRCTVHERIGFLVDRGMISRTKRWARSWVPTDQGCRAVSCKCPHCGGVLTDT